MSVLISIILPNYNHAIYLIDRLDSIFNQTYQNFEVIILDDASTDDSLAILNMYRNHPKVSNFIRNEKNTGSPFKQWAKGLRLAKGDLIWIAESDDDCDLNFLESQVKRSLIQRQMSLYQKQSPSTVIKVKLRKLGIMFLEIETVMQE